MQWLGCLTPDGSVLELKTNVHSLRVSFIDQEAKLVNVNVKNDNNISSNVITILLWI